jgi:tetratricopeptide (TPR) repeat protein
MFRKIWQTILNLWRKIFPQPKPPAPPPPTPIRSFGEYEQKFMALLEGVAQGWSRGEIKGFLIGSNIKDAEWVNWLQEFGERLLVSPETHLELGGRMVRLGEMNCGRISEVAGKIGRELLDGESLNLTPADDSLVMSENIVTKLLARESLSSPTDSLSEANQGDSTSQSESIGREISKEAKELYKQGVNNYYAEDLEGAIVAFETALEIDPKFHHAWYRLGDTLNDLGRNSEAITAFNQALEIDSKYIDAWYGLGWVLKDLGRYSEAIAAYETALEIDPKDHYAWNALGNALKDLDRNSEAIAAYETALEIDPKYVNAWNGLGTSLYQLGRNSEAIAAYKKALEIDPKYHLTWNFLGWLLKNLRCYKEAIASFDKALEIKDNQLWQAWDDRGLAFLYSGRYIEAIQNWDEGLQKYQPSNRDYRLACGNLHQQKGKAHYKHGKQTATYFESFHKAKASYEQAREFLKSPLIPETYLEVMQGLINVCRSLGDAKTSEYLTEATTVLETLLLDNETHPEIKLRLQRKFVGLYQLEVDILVEFGDKVNALEKAESRKNFCLQWMRPGSPNRIDSPTYPQIRDLLANNTATAIIYWHLSPVSLTAFIITPDKFETISTPVTDIFAKRDSTSLEKWLENWKTNYQNYCQTTNKQQSKESHPWRESMTAQLPQLADILKIPEICTHLTNIQHLILIPHRDLHLLPLDSLFLPPFFTDAVTDTRKNQIRSITRLPSAQIAIQQQQQNPTEIAPNSMLMVEHSQGKSTLKFTQIEAAAISQINQTNRPSNQGERILLNTLR